MLLKENQYYLMRIILVLQLRDPFEVLKLNTWNTKLTIRIRNFVDVNKTIFIIFHWETF